MANVANPQAHGGAIIPSRRRRIWPSNVTAAPEYIHSTICFSVWLLLVAAVSAQRQFYFTSCFDHLAAADDDANLKLSRVEFGKFLLTQSGGTVLLQVDPPNSVMLPFSSRRKSANDNFMDISGIAMSSVNTSAAQIADMESFCREIYIGLALHFKLEVSQNKCVGAFQTADTSPQNSRLDPKEYPLFISTLVETEKNATVDKFDDLPRSLTDAFNDMSIDGEIPESNDNGYLLEFCKRVLLAVKISTPPPAPTKAPAIGVSSADLALSAANFTNCRTALIVADVNRDNWLQPDEYAKFVSKFSAELSASDFVSLALLFQEQYTNLTQKGDAAPNLRGSKPGVVATDQELATLKNICITTYRIVERYQAVVGLLVPAPSTNLPPNADAFFDSCTAAMVISDIDRNGLLKKDEYVRFVDRLSVKDLSGVSFDKLDPLFLKAFSNATGALDKSSVDITGIKPGQSPSVDQLIKLRVVCSQMKLAVEAFEKNGPSPISPIAANSPSLAPVDVIDELPNEFSRLCTTAMLIADGDRNDELSKEEYVRLLNRLTLSKFPGMKFVNLDPVFKISFEGIAADHSIDIVGSKPGTSPTDSETDHLQRVCLTVYSAIEEYNTANAEKTKAPIASPVPSLAPSDNEDNTNVRCIQSLHMADGNFDNALNKTEYLYFLNIFSGTNGKILTDLPFILQDNFEWVSQNQGVVRIRGSSPSIIRTSGDALRLQWICERTNSALLLSERTRNVSFESFCDVSLSKSDTDSDGFLSKFEYESLVHSMSGGGRQGNDFMIVNPQSFVEFEKDHSRLNISGANSTDVCHEIKGSIEDSRKDIAFFEQCKLSFVIADNDRNSLLNASEYFPFIFNLATVYDLSIGVAQDDRFEDLRPELQLNFDALAINMTTISIGGLYSGVSSREANNLYWICNSTSRVFGQIIENTTAKVFNSFTISNAVGIKADDFKSGSLNRNAVSNAYAMFVEEQVSNLSGSLSVRGLRKLKVDGVTPFSSTIYQIDDVTCPTASPQEESCQVVYVSFTLDIRVENDPDAISRKYSDHIQGAIDQGVLQAKLEEVNPQSQVRIVESYFPLQPQDSAVGLPPPEADVRQVLPSHEGSGLKIPVVLGISIGLGVIGAGFSFFLYKRRKKKCNAVDLDSKEVGRFSSPDRKTQSVYSFTTGGLIFQDFADSVRNSVTSMHTKSPIERQEQYPGPADNNINMETHQVFCNDNSNRCVLQDGFKYDLDLEKGENETSFDRDEIKCDGNAVGALGFGLVKNSEKAFRNSLYNSDSQIEAHSTMADFPIGNDFSAHQTIETASATNDSESVGPVQFSTGEKHGFCITSIEDFEDEYNSVRMHSIAPNEYDPMEQMAAPQFGSNRMDASRIDLEIGDCAGNDFVNKTGRKNTEGVGSSNVPPQIEIASALPNDDRDHFDDSFGSLRDAHVNTYFDASPTVDSTICEVSPSKRHEKVELDLDCDKPAVVSLFSTDGYHQDHHQDQGSFIVNVPDANFDLDDEFMEEILDDEEFETEELTDEEIEADEDSEYEEECIDEDCEETLEIAGKANFADRSKRETDDGNVCELKQVVGHHNFVSAVGESRSVGNEDAIRVGELYEENENTYHETEIVTEYIEENSTNEKSVESSEEQIIESPDCRSDDEHDTTEREEEEDSQSVEEVTEISEEASIHSEGMKSLKSTGGDNFESDEDSERADEHRISSAEDESVGGADDQSLASADDESLASTDDEAMDKRLASAEDASLSSAEDESTESSKVLAGDSEEEESESQGEVACASEEEENDSQEEATESEEEESESQGDVASASKEEESESQGDVASASEEEESESQGDVASASEGEESDSQEEATESEEEESESQGEVARASEDEESESQGDMASASEEEVSESQGDIASASEEEESESQGDTASASEEEESESQGDTASASEEEVSESQGDTASSSVEEGSESQGEEEKSNSKESECDSDD